MKPELTRGMNTRTSLDKYRDAGYSARDNGRALEDNPYGGNAGAEWAAGWWDHFRENGDGEEAE